MRVHSLPGSRRHAENEPDYAEIIRRHRTVLRELAASPRPGEPDIIVVTCSWSAGPAPIPRSAPVEDISPAAGHWQSLLTDDDPDSPVWTHLFAEKFRLSDRRLDQLLRIVADNQTAGILITDPNVRWLYHPYDSGADIITSTPGSATHCAQRITTGYPPTHPAGNPVLPGPRGRQHGGYEMEQTTVTGPAGSPRVTRSFAVAAQITCPDPISGLRPVTW